MPIPAKSKLPVALLAVVALLALPAAANATLTYTKGFQNPHVYYAEDNGKGAHQIGLGRNSHVSPNGESVIYERETGGNGATEMRLYDVAIGKSERLIGNWRESFVTAWSPDSSMVAALTGPLNGQATLVVINVETGRHTKIGKGYFNGVSFSPESTELVYGVSKTPDYPPTSDIFKVSVEGGKPVALSHNQTSAYPLWAPTGQIAFARLLGGKTRKYGPKNELFVMNEEGQRISQLSHTEVNPFAQGLTPIAWSENGTRLLTEFGGQDQSYAVALNTVTGAEKALTNNPETGFTGSGLSPDGTTVLGTAGLGFGGNPHPQVVTVPWSGGKPKVLVNGAYEPSWGS